jgi:hypothetical protein
MAEIQLPRAHKRVLLKFCDPMKSPYPEHGNFAGKVMIGKRDSAGNIFTVEGVHGNWSADAFDLWAEIPPTE